MTARASAWVDKYLQNLARTKDINRVVTESPGLDATGVLEVLGDRRLGQDVMHAMSDLIRPEASMYYDAIYGAFHGQVAIRNWLVPTMAEIPFIEFVPQQPTDLFERDGGTSSVDEWQMFMTLEGERFPLPRGVSVRHYEDGWITWNADVYDTGAFRTPPDDVGEAPPLPPPPQTEWTSVPIADRALSDDAQQWLAGRSERGPHQPSGLSHADLHAVAVHPVHGADANVIADLMHPTASVYLDPLFGDFAGQDDIRAWLNDVMPKVGNIRFDQVGPVLFNGSCSVLEWMQMAVLPDGRTQPMLRGTSVRRYDDGWITYAADYFDTAQLSDPAITEAGVAAGATLTMADIERYQPA